MNWEAKRVGVLLVAATLFVVFCGCGGLLSVDPGSGNDDEGPGGTSQPVIPAKLTGALRVDYLTVRFDEDGKGQAIVLSREKILDLATQMGLYDPSALEDKSRSARQATGEYATMQLGDLVSLDVGGLSFELENLSYDPGAATVVIEIRVDVRDADGALLGSGTIRFVLSDIEVGEDGTMSAGQMTVSIIDQEGVETTLETLVGTQLATPAENTPPSAVAVAVPATAGAGDTVLLSGTGSFDLDGEPLSFVWEQTAGEPVVSLAGSASDTATFVTPSLTEDMTISFTLSVSDAEEISTASVVILLLKANASPVADAGDDQTVKPGDPVELDGSESNDPDGDALSFSWQQTAGSVDVTLADASSAAPSFVVPLSITEDTTFTFELIVSDGDLEATDMVDVVVAMAGGGGGGGGGETSPSPILTLIPDDVTIMFAIHNLSDLGNGVEELLDEPGFVHDLLDTLNLDPNLADLGAGFAFFLRESDGLTAALLGVRQADFLGFIDDVSNGAVGVNNVGDGVVELVNFMPTSLFLTSMDNDNHIVLAGSKADALTATGLGGLDTRFDQSWLDAYEQGDLVLYTDTATLYDYLFNNDAIFDLFAGDEVIPAEAGCVIIDVGDPLLISAWSRFEEGSQPALDLLANPGTEESLLVGLPDEPTLLAMGGLPGSTDLMAAILSDVDPGVLEGLTSNSTLSFGSPAEGDDDGLVRMANIVNVSHANPAVDAASVQIDLIRMLVAELQEQLVGTDGEGLLTYVENAETTLGVGQRVVDHMVIDVDLLLTLLDLVPEEYADQIASIFGSDPLVFRIVKISTTQVGVSMGGGLPRLEEMIALALAGEAPLASRPIISDLDAYLSDHRYFEAYLAPAQLPKMIYDIANVLGAELPWEDDPGHATAAIGMISGRDGLSARVDIVIPADVLLGTIGFLQEVGMGFVPPPAPLLVAD